VQARLAALADEIDGDLVTARAGYASALAAQNSTDLDKIANDFEHLGANLYAAEASAEAAVILRRAGKTREARAAEHNASRLLTRCEGAVTPAVQTVTARALLTPGELDAAVQAAAGRSDKQIAADMHVRANCRKPPATRLRKARDLGTPRAVRCATRPAHHRTVDVLNPTPPWSPRCQQHLLPYPHPSPPS
jgi:hypothetical protein